MLNMGYLDPTVEKFLELQEIAKPQLFPRMPVNNIYAGRKDLSGIYLEICENDIEFDVLKNEDRCWYIGKKVLP